MSDVTEGYLQQLERLCQQATAGPWHTVCTDDENSMNSVYVGTAFRGEGHDNEQGMDGRRCGEIIAATLYQMMPRIDHDTGLWDENADFIAESRTALPLLIAEVRRLRTGFAELSSKYENLLSQLSATDA